MSNVPKLRFKEFSGEWLERKLIDTVDTNIKWSFTGGPFGSDLKADDYTEEGVRIIQLQNIGDGSFLNSYAIYTSEKKADKLLSCNIYPNEIILSKMGDPVARACKMPLSDKRYVMASDGIRYVPDETEHSKDFLFFSINHPSFRKQAIINSTGSTRKRIGLAELRNLKFNIPLKQEQEKIASFLTSVDTKIEQLTKKEALLSSYKKGVMQKIFNQEIRFKADDGSEFCDWEETKLGEYLKLKSKKNKDNLVDLVLSVSNKKGFITQDEQFDGYEVASKDTSGYKIVEKGDYAYNPSRINVGSIARLKNYDTGIVSPMYVVFSLTNKMSPIFFDSLYQIHRFKHLIKIGCSGSVRDSLAFDDMADFNITVPCLEEQTKIANFLSSIDSKIEQVQKQLNSTKEFKKALLQQMFV